MSKFFSIVAGACKFVEIMSSISAGAEKKQENRELRVSREILKAYATYSDVVSRDTFSARDARAVLHRLDCAEKDNHEYYISRVYAYLIPFHKKSFDIVFTDRVEGKQWSESVNNVLHKVRWLRSARLTPQLWGKPFIFCLAPLVVCKFYELKRNRRKAHETFSFSKITVIGNSFHIVSPSGS